MSEPLTVDTFDPFTDIPDDVHLGPTPATTFALEAWMSDGATSAIDTIERSLLGTFLLVPDWLDDAALLDSRDFRAPARGQVLFAMRDFPRRRFDLALVAHELERREVKAPPGVGWVAALATLLDDAVCDRVLMSPYARAIKEAAALRRIEEPKRARR